MSFLKSIAFKRTTAIGWYTLIILGSSIPGKKIPEIFTLTPDKLIHCVEYLVLGFLLMRWLTSDFTSFTGKKSAVIVLLVGALCAMADELYQNLTPNRTPDFYDWCLDVVGLMISIPFFDFLRRKIYWI
ncbi:MAG: VanZ family protein [Bacteroidetes bacterium]|nr:VanZ family protein [Bacteroidota bacterium]